MNDPPPRHPQVAEGGAVAESYHLHHPLPSLEGVVEVEAQAAGNRVAESGGWRRRLARTVGASRGDPQAPKAVGEAACYGSPMFHDLEDAWWSASEAERLQFADMRKA
jgi:hypothetical protein